MITIVLHDWQRRRNQLKLIAALRKQTSKCKIFVWNNNPEPFPQEDVDWVINSSLNYHQYPFPWLARQADTKYVGQFDDDLMPCGRYVLEDMERELKHINNADTILGYCGVQLREDKDYWQSRHINEPNPLCNLPVDIVKGRVMFMNRLGIRDYPKTIHLDISLSMSMPGNHIVSQYLYRAIKELPEGKCGYCAQPNHIADRNAALAAWR